MLTKETYKFDMTCNIIGLVIVFVLTVYSGIWFILLSIPAGLLITLRYIAHKKKWD